MGPPQSLESAVESKNKSTNHPQIPAGSQPVDGRIGRRAMTAHFSREVGYWDGYGTHHATQQDIGRLFRASIPVPGSRLCRYCRRSAVRRVRHGCEMSETNKRVVRFFYQRPNATK